MTPEERHTCYLISGSLKFFPAIRRSVLAFLNETQVGLHAMPPGFLALILHAHLPFVRHPEHEEFLEEDWLFEAITETYLPLLDVLNTLAEEGVRFRLAMSLTPTLGHMLRDPLLRTRYERYLARLLAMAEDEARRANEEMAGVARFYVLRLLRVREWWEKWGDIV